MQNLRFLPLFPPVVSTRRALVSMLACATEPNRRRNINQGQGQYWGCGYQRTDWPRPCTLTAIQLNLSERAVYIERGKVRCLPLSAIYVALPKVITSNHEMLLLLIAFI